MGIIRVMRFGQFNPWWSSPGDRHVNCPELDVMIPFKRHHLLPHQRNSPKATVIMRACCQTLVIASVVGMLSLNTETGRESDFQNSCQAQTIGALSSGTETESDFTQDRHREAESSLYTLPVYSEAQTLRKDSTLRAVAFGDQQTGIACGDRGVILRTQDSGATWGEIESRCDCMLLDVVWMNRQHVVIVGGSLDRITGLSRGIVLRSDDAGETWKQSNDSELPRLNQLSWDGEKLEAKGDWSNSLLTDTFACYDRGLSWHADSRNSTRRMDASSSISERSEYSIEDQVRWRVATQQLITARDACRTSQHGRCLVGDHGVIITSKDDGQTWQFSRGENRKTAILFVTQRPSSAPWSLVGREALESRHRINILCQFADSSERGMDIDPSRSLWETSLALQNARQAAIASGAASFDLLENSQQVRAETVSQPTSKHWESVAKRWIAVCQPTVLVLDESLNPSLKSAFLASGVASSVQRVIEYSFSRTMDSKRRQGSLMHHDALLSKTGILASDLQADASHWIAPTHHPIRSIQTITLYDVASNPSSGDSLMNGIAPRNGEKLSTKAQQTSRRKLQMARARINRDTQIRKLIQSSKNEQHFSDLFSHLVDSTSKEDQFRLTWATIIKTSQTITDQRLLRIHEAALKQCVKRFPGQSASHWASLRLDVMQNSNEWRRLRTLIPKDSQHNNNQWNAEEVVVSPFQKPENNVQQVAAISPVVVPRLETTRPTEARANQGQLTVDLPWEFHPTVLLSREASRLRSDEGGLQPATQTSSNLVRLAESEHPWSDLLRIQGPRTLHAEKFIHPPRLDGQLNDECWRNAKFLPMHSHSNSQTMSVCHDDEYVYLAARIPRAAISIDTTQPDTPLLQRDQTLNDVDRLCIQIDTDRDLMSTMQLQVTSSGRVNDTIDGHPSWQPTWYPAISLTDQLVTFEIAILRRDITELPITARESWFLSVTPLSAGQFISDHVIPEPERWLGVIFD